MTFRTKNLSLATLPCLFVVCLIVCVSVQPLFGQTTSPETINQKTQAVEENQQDIKGHTLQSNFGYLYGLTVEWGAKRTLGLYFYEFLEEFVDFELKVESEDTEDSFTLSRESAYFQSKTNSGFFGSANFSNTKEFTFELSMNDKVADSVTIPGEPVPTELNVTVLDGFLKRDVPSIRLLVSVGAEGFTVPDSLDVLGGPHLFVEMYNFELSRWERIEQPRKMVRGTTQVHTFRGNKEHYLNFANQAKFRVSKAIPRIDHDPLETFMGGGLWMMDSLKVRWDKERLSSGSLRFEE